MTFDELLLQLEKEELRKEGKAWEKLCVWFLCNSPVYKSELEKVWSWNDWPGRWGGDAGIDVVAKHKDGTLWAIQCKNYAAEYSITKHDIDSFLSESSSAEFSFRLLMATTDRVGTTARRTVQRQEKPAALLLASDLAIHEIDWPDSLGDLRSTPLPKKKPRPHQAKAINDVVKGLKTYDRGQLVMACGTGKTVTSLFIKEKLNSRRTLVLVPSLSLLSPTIAEWVTNARSDFEFLAVCSDDTVITDNDAAVQTTSDLGLPVTTDKAKIEGFLRQRKELVVFSTYQSSPEVAKAMRNSNIRPFDLAIADEAHRCAGLASGDFATILDQDLIKANKRLFMTATPRFFTGRVLTEAKEADLEIASMDNEMVFGPVLHSLSFGEAIRNDLLSDYQVVVIGVDDETCRDYVENGRVVTVDGKSTTDARTLGSQIGLAKALKKFNLHRVITFHSRIKAASRFANDFPETALWVSNEFRHIWSSHVSGEMASGERHRLLARLAEVEHDEYGVIANARCLSEGVNVPTLDGVAFIEPKRSEVDIVQAIGRAIRKAPDKKIGTVVIPVFIATGEDADEVLASSSFRDVWRIIDGLRAHDNTLAEQIDELRMQLGKGGLTSFNLPSKIVFDFPDTLGSEFANSFSVELVRATSEAWEEWFGLLGEYVKEYDTSRVTKDQQYRGMSLGNWIVKVRAKYKDGSLSPDKITRLESLPKWSWAPFDDAWERSYALVAQYAEEHGTSLIKRGAVVRDGVDIGNWIIIQRSMNAKNELDEQRKRQLEELPKWSWNLLSDSWEEKFAATMEYSVKYRIQSLPRSTNFNGVNIFNWIIKQRTSYRQNKLTEEQISRCETIPGWSWAPDVDSWQKSYDVYKRYVQENGTTAVPDGLTVDGVNLTIFVGNQRNYYRRRKLATKYITLMEEIPGWFWDPREAKWEQAFEILRAFVKERGSARPADDETYEGFRLGQWVRVQRRAMKAGDVSTDRRKRLESLDGWEWESSYGTKKGKPRIHRP
jgi:superfamily II DNA or RNA helicase